MRHIGEFKKDAIITPLVMIGEVVCEMIVPLLMATLIDDGVEQGNMGVIVRTSLIMLVVVLCGLAVGCLGSVFGSKAAAGFARNLRQDQYDNIQTFSFSNIDRFSTPSLVTRLTTDVMNIQNAFMMILRMVPRAFSSLIVAMCMAFVVSGRMALIYLGAVIFLGIVLAVLMNIAAKYFRKAFPEYDVLNENTEENITAIRAVKAFDRETMQIGLFKEISRRIYEIFLKAELTLAAVNPVIQFTVWASLLLISWVGAHLIVDDQLTAGDLTSLLMYCMNILMSLVMLSMTIVMITMSSASARRIAEVLTEQCDMAQSDDPVREVASGAIDFNDVDFSYPQVKVSEHDPTAAKRALQASAARSRRERVLDDIDVHIPSGSVVGVIGGTGSAKTTLVNLIPRLYDVTGGSVMVGGVDVRDYDIDVLRDKVSVVLQNNVLFSGTIASNLRWGNPDATLDDMKRVCRIACADEFIESLPDGYDAVVEQGGQNFSGGQKQRLCIARALLKKPKILILDDSTSAVDTKTDKLIREAFHHEIPDTTKIIIAQRVASVQESDMILVMDEGRIMARGTHEELLRTCDEYRSIYESQTKNTAQGQMELDRSAAEDAAKVRGVESNSESSNESGDKAQEGEAR